MSVKITAIASIVMALAAASTLHAESVPAAITVQEAVAAALKNNISVKSAAVQERIKKRASDFSFNQLYPTATVSVTAMRLNKVSAVSVPAGEIAPDTYDCVYQYEPDAANLALRMTIQETFSPVYIGAINQLSLDYQESVLSKAKAERQIAAAVKKMYYQLVVQKSAIEFTRARLENAEERLRQATVARELGQGTELNWLYAAQSAESLVPELRSMETARAIALAKFRELLGFGADDAVEVSGSIDDAFAAELPPAPAGSRIDVREAEMSAEKLKNALAVRNLSFLPNLSVQYSADPSLNGPTADNMFDSSNWRQSSGGISVTLAWDVSGFIPGSDAQIKRAELKERLALAREAADISVRTAMRDEENQARLVGDSLAKIGNLEHVVDSTRRAYELTDASWNAGVGRYLDLQSAEISYQSSRMQLLNERLNLLSLAFDFEAKYLR